MKGGKQSSSTDPNSFLLRLTNKEDQRSGMSGLKIKIGVTEGIMRSIISESSPILRLGGGAPVCLTAIQEYLCAELLELSGNETRARGGSNTIEARDLVKAVLGDEELHETFQEMMNVAMVCFIP